MGIELVGHITEWGWEFYVALHGLKIGNVGCKGDLVFSLTVRTAIWWARLDCRRCAFRVVLLLTVLPPLAKSSEERGAVYV